MKPVKSHLLMVAPPTLEKRLDVLRAIETLAAPVEGEQQQGRRAGSTATRNDFEKLHRDCEALEKAMHDACREAAQIVLHSRLRRRAAARRHRALTDALRKRGTDGYDPDEPRIPKHHTGGGEWTSSTIAAADNVNVRPGEPPPIPDPASIKPVEVKPAEHGLATEIYNATLRAPIRDLAD